MNSFCQR